MVETTNNRDPDEAAYKSLQIWTYTAYSKIYLTLILAEL